MIIRNKQISAYTMNQFLYFHALKGDKVKEALLNEAYDIGMLPMKGFYHYGLIEINLHDRTMQTITFGNDRDLLMKVLKENKARDLILFNYIPLQKDGQDAFEPVLTVVDSFIRSRYAILGTVVVNDVDLLTDVIESIGIKLPERTSGDQTKQVFLADLALADNYKTKRLVSKSRADFIAIKYDVYGNIAKPEQIFIGSNNDYLRVFKTKKYFYVSSMWTADKGKRPERGGKIMGGNVIAIDCYQDNRKGFVVKEELYLRHHIYGSSDKVPLVIPDDLNLDTKYEAKKLRFYNIKTKTHIAVFSPDTKKEDRNFGFETTQSCLYFNEDGFVRSTRVAPSQHKVFLEPSDLDSKLLIKFEKPIKTA